MKKVLFMLMVTAGLTAQAQTQDHWYGYPPQRQTSAAVGVAVGAISYSIIRANMEHEPKWKPLLISAGFTALASAAVYSIAGDFRQVERRQNATATLASGIGISLVFSLGI
jgi:hypothetical protein